MNSQNLLKRTLSVLDLHNSLNINKSVLHVPLDIVSHEDLLIALTNYIQFKIIVTDTGIIVSPFCMNNSYPSRHNIYLNPNSSNFNFILRLLPVLLSTILHNSNHQGIPEFVMSNPNEINYQCNVNFIDGDKLNMAFCFRSDKEIITSYQIKINNFGEDSLVYLPTTFIILERQNTMVIMSKIASQLCNKLVYIPIEKIKIESKFKARKELSIILITFNKLSLRLLIKKGKYVLYKSLKTTNKNLLDIKVKMTNEQIVSEGNYENNDTIDQLIVVMHNLIIDNLHND